MDKLDFFQEASLYFSFVVDDEKAMGDLFHFLRGVMPLHALSWHVYDPSLKGLHLEAVITAEGMADLKNQRVPLSKQACRRAEELDRRRFILIESTAEDSLAAKVVEVLAPFIGVGDKSLFFVYLERGGTPLGHLCIIFEEPGPWEPEHLELCTMLAPPFSFAIYHMRRFMELTLLKNRVTEEKEFLAQELRRTTDHELIGADSGLREIKTSIEQLALVETPALIMGETGVGKELVANAIQRASPRRNGPYVKVNCGAIPDTLIDSELFGHERGAFTGAFNLRKGKFELADGGTIFLDEIGELPPQAQVRLLRVLQNHEVERIGGSQRIEVDVRFIAATHRNILDMVRRGQFREDLFYRINVFPIVIPPLRHRMQDIPELVVHLMEKKVQDMKLRRVPELEPDAIKSLLNHDWPGNVRELENLVERALILHPKGPLSFSGLVQTPSSIDKNVSNNKEKTLLPLDEVIRGHIKRALILSRGKINGPGGAAERLHIHPNTLRRRMDKLNIPYGKKDVNTKILIQNRGKPGHV
jgi:transcriptional regulator with GAF, ATPase, and Fis domain